jgi:hypothetical protein
MWLGLPALLLLVLAVVGAIVGGGVFAFVLLPVVVIVVVAGVTFAVWGRSQKEPSGRSQARQTGDPLPHGQGSNVPASPATPDQLVDARQGEQ